MADDVENADEGEKKGPESFGEMAVKTVNRARKTVRDPEGGPTTQFLVQSATIYAILELADAIRGTKSA